MRFRYFSVGVLMLAALAWLFLPTDAPEVDAPVRSVHLSQPSEIEGNTSTAASADKPQGTSELQQYSGDYYVFAVDLLQKAREGDGQSQFDLANLLLVCETMLFVDDAKDRDTALQLLAYDLTVKEQAMLSEIRLNAEQCQNFRGIDFGEFADGKSNAIDYLTFWLKQALNHDMPDAAIILLGLNSYHGGLTAEEVNRAKAILRAVINKPSNDNMFYLSSLFSKHKYASAHVATYHTAADFPTTISQQVHKVFSKRSILNCLKDKYIQLMYVEAPFDCAERVGRYGAFYDPKDQSEIEAEAAQIEQAWERGDYAGAGFEALMPYLADSPNE